MKIIDLLVKLSNGEEVPKYISYYKRISRKKDIMMVCKENIIYLLDQLEIELNDEIEIIEDKPKKVEKIKPIKMVGCNIEFKIGEEKTFLPTETMQYEIAIHKINEIIKQVNYLLEKSDK